MSSPERHAAMVEFLASFSTVTLPPGDLAELSDGVVLFEALSEIAPAYFDPTTIARHLGDNWVLKSSNLRKLVRNLTQYYHEDLQKDADFDAIDQKEIAREATPQAVEVLVELVAAAAVTCPEKGNYVGRIMQMTPSSQAAMKEIIQSSLQRLKDFTDDAEQSGEENEMVFGQDEEDFDQAEQDQSSVREDDPDSLFAHHGINLEAEQELAEARRELAALQSQTAVVEEESEKAQNKLRGLVEDLQDRLKHRQEDLAALEEDLNKTVTELADAKAKLATAEEQKAQLADDLDVANAKAQQLRKAEATVAAYKKKLDSAGVMNQQVTELEDQAASYLRQIMELENEAKKSTSLQKMVNDLQEQIADLEKHRTHTESSTKTSVTEIVDLKSQLQAAESAKKMYEEELKELRAQQEDHVEEPVAPAVTSVPSQEQREKTMRLEIENKQLQEEVAALKAAAAAAAVTAASKVAASDDGNSAELSKEIKQLKEQLDTKKKENAKISSDKDKLEAYTKRTLAKFQDKYLVALQECKAKLKEKQDKIEVLEQRSASERTAQKREERLLSSTIYELGLAIMQNRLKSGSGS